MQNKGESALLKRIFFVYTTLSLAVCFLYVQKFFCVYSNGNWLKYIWTSEASKSKHAKLIFWAPMNVIRI